MKYDFEKVNAQMAALSRRSHGLHAVMMAEFNLDRCAQICFRLTQIHNRWLLLMDCKALILWGAKPTGWAPAGRLCLPA